MLGLFAFKPRGYAPDKNKSSSFIILKKRGIMVAVSDTWG